MPSPASGDPPGAPPPPSSDDEDFDINASSSDEEIEVDQSEASQSSVSSDEMARMKLMSQSRARSWRSYGLSTTSTMKRCWSTWADLLIKLHTNRPKRRQVDFRSDPPLMR